MSAEPPFTVHIAHDAAARIRSRGGRLYLWSRPLGRVGARDSLSYVPPGELAFECYHDAKRDVQICVPPEFPAREVIVRARRWPLPGVRVYVNGRRWGWRGESFDSPLGG